MLHRVKEKNKYLILISQIISSLFLYNIQAVAAINKNAGLEKCSISLCEMQEYFQENAGLFLIWSCLQMTTRLPVRMYTKARLVCEDNIDSLFSSPSEILLSLHSEGNTLVHYERNTCYSFARIPHGTVSFKQSASNLWYH